MVAVAVLIVSCAPGNRLITTAVMVWGKRCLESNCKLCLVLGICEEVIIDS